MVDAQDGLSRGRLGESLARVYPEVNAKKHPRPLPGLQEKAGVFLLAWTRYQDPSKRQAARQALPHAWSRVGTTGR
jgi:hypothetical protein